MLFLCLVSANVRVASAKMFVKCSLSTLFKWNLARSKGSRDAAGCEVSVISQTSRAYMVPLASKYAASAKQHIIQ